MASKPQLFEDRILPFQVDELNIRGRVVRLGESVTNIINSHQYPKPVSNLLMEAMAMCVTLASGLKYDGIFSLQAISEGDGAGPVKVLVTNMTSEGGIRGYVGYDEEKLAALSDEDASELSKILGTGRLAFTVDQGKHMQPYQGITGLEGDSMEECVAAYFNASEQLPSQFMSAHGEAGACVVMIQKLGDINIDEDEAKEKWNHACIMMQSLKDEELLDPTLGMADLPYRLFHDQGVRVYETKQVHKDCRCSPEKLVKVLDSLPIPELEDMIIEGGTTLTCHFCPKDFKFTPDELKELIKEKQSG